jgi:hypothetical protein
MHPYPDRPAPEGWVHIEHPDVGPADHPVKRTSLPVWEKAGWAEVATTGEPVPGGTDPVTSTPSRRQARTVTDAAAKEL